MLAFSSSCNENTQSTKEHTLLVGYGRADISPTEPVTMGDGYFGVYSLSTEVLHPLYATCIAFTDANDNTVLLYHMDLGSVSDTVIYARGYVAKQLNLSANQIMVAATHTHFAPNVVENTTNDVE